jgi:hypothetical protein
MTCRFERIEHIFKFMEYDVLKDNELDLVGSFESQWLSSGSLSDRQLEVLEDIFKQAAERWR